MYPTLLTDWLHSVLDQQLKIKINLQIQGILAK